MSSAADKEKKYRRIFENIQDLYYEAAPDGTILEVSPSSRQVLGFDRTELLGKNIKILYSDPAHREGFMKELLYRGKVQDYGLEFKHKDGHPVYCSVNVSLHLDDAGRPSHHVGSLRDVTAQKVAERELRAMEQHLAHSQKLEAVGTLASGIAHDFNNLLQAIIGNVELLKEDPLEDTLKGRVLAIGRAAESASTLVQSLLTLGRQTPPKMAPTSLNKHVQSTMDLLTRTLPESIAVKTYLSPNLWSIMADGGQLEQVVMNLVANARDAMAEGGELTVETDNFVANEDFCRAQPAMRPGSFVYLKVSDTGSGMDQATAQRIFDPFFTTKPIGSGSGLGLSIVNSIVKAHRGFVICETEPDFGSDFSVFLPAE